MLQLFTSSIFIAGAMMSIFASWLTRVHGRKPSMAAGGLCFLAGAALNAAAQNTAMLVVGRILLGFGLGESPQA